MRLLPPLDADGEPIGHGQRYTYRDLSERSAKVSETLRRLGLPVSGKVLLLSENRPDWAISYFGILKCAAVVVPVDKDASLEEVLNICRFADVYAAIVSDKVQARIDVRGALAQTMPSVKVLNFRELFSAETPPRLWRQAVCRRLRCRAAPTDGIADFHVGHDRTAQRASCCRIATSRRFWPKWAASSMSTSTMVFCRCCRCTTRSEFSAGLLMPMSRGAQIAYLPEVNADSLQNAFSSAHITGMVGVPALYQLLYRRITKQISDRLPQRAVPWCCVC